MTTAVAWYELSAKAGLAPRNIASARSTRRASAFRKDLDRGAEMVSAAPPMPATSRRCTISRCSTPRARAATPDLEKASGLFRQAAERGVRDSQFNLAILHARGLGVPQDLVEAYKWFADRGELRRRGIRQAARHHRPGALRQRQAKAEQAIATFQPTPVGLRRERGPACRTAVGVGRQLRPASMQVGQRARRPGAEAPCRERLRSGAAGRLLGSKTMDAISRSRARPGCRRPARSTPSSSRRCRPVRPEVGGAASVPRASAGRTCLTAPLRRRLFVAGPP